MKIGLFRRSKERVSVSTARKSESFGEQGDNHVSSDLPLLTPCPPTLQHLTPCNSCQFPHPAALRTGQESVEDEEHGNQPSSELTFATKKKCGATVLENDHLTIRKLAETLLYF
ncbi:unnamed protein product [Bemisia tabaci]|uniref:Uncharacterized protein n=1 Tax=Bemisia tabaci TaxID=7038 RepID=A0A9P0F0E6_BEMTA|nr:unnamed protein product [Bemisia tabaci]